MTVVVVEEVDVFLDLRRLQSANEFQLPCTSVFLSPSYEAKKRSPYLSPMEQSSKEKRGDDDDDEVELEGGVEGLKSILTVSAGRVL